MSSIPCTTNLIFTPKPYSSSSSSSSSKLCSHFLGFQSKLGFLRQSRIGPSNGSRTKCWFKFGKNGVDSENAGIYGSQSRDDFDRDDVEQYFNYMGMLAVEGTYDKMEALLSQEIHPVDILLLMAASEGDKPKIEELLRAGASYTVADADGRTALERAANDEIKDFILSFSVQKDHQGNLIARKLCISVFGFTKTPRRELDLTNSQAQENRIIYYSGINSGSIKSLSSTRQLIGKFSQSGLQKMPSDVPIGGTAVALDSMIYVLGGSEHPEIGHYCTKV